MKVPLKFGVRYQDGKILFYSATHEGNFDGSENPGGSVPAWAVDIREVLAMLFVGLAALCLILKGYIQEAMYLLLPLTGYAIGRTVPYPFEKVVSKKKKNGEK